MFISHTHTHTTIVHGDRYANYPEQYYNVSKTSVYPRNENHIAYKN